MALANLACQLYDPGPALSRPASLGRKLKQIKLLFFFSFSPFSCGSTSTYETCITIFDLKVRFHLPLGSVFVGSDDDDEDGDDDDAKKNMFQYGFQSDVEYCFYMAFL